jgi:hypothetical protein
MLIGIWQIRGGEPAGWALVAGSAVLWLVIILAPLWAPRGYRIGDAAVFVSKRVGDEELPFEKMAAIEIRDSKEVFESAIRIAGSGGAYGTYGYFTGGVLVSFKALVTNDGPLVVVRMKKGDPIVLSPENPHDFARELSSRAGVPVQEAAVPVGEEAKPFRPPLTRGQMALEIVAVGLVIASFAAALHFWHRLPGTIPTHFGATGIPDGWGPKKMIWLLPEIALGTYILLTAVTAFVSRMNKASAAHPKARRMVDLLRWVLGINKCYVVGLFAFITWQTGLTALGKSQGLGIGLLIVTLIFFLVVEPAMVIFALIRATKSEDS